MTRRRVILAGLLLTTSGAVAAQDLGGALDLGQLGTSMAVNQGIQRQLQRRSGTPAPKTRSAPPVSAAAVRARLNFRADPTLSRRIVGAYIGRIRAGDPVTADQLQRSFAAQPVATMAGKWLRPYGMSPANAADAAAAYLSTAWLVAHGSNGDPTRAQIVGLRDQLARAMAGTPALLNASDVTKQEFAESLLIQAAVNGALLQGAGGNRARAREVSATVARSVRSSFGIDLLRSRLTAQGLTSS
jgi:hypothetical protein